MGIQELLKKSLNLPKTLSKACQNRLDSTQTAFYIRI